MAKKSWYLKGKAGQQRSEEIDKRQKQRRSQQDKPRRFWQDNNQSSRVIFLDTPDFWFYEHNLYREGRWFNYATCLCQLDEEADCAPCIDGDTPSFVLAGSTLVLRPWEDRDGTQHKAQKMPFVVKGRARHNLLRQIKKRNGDLARCVFDVDRGPGHTEANTGENFDFVRRLTEKELQLVAEKLELQLPEEYDSMEQYLQPYDYEAIFAPQTEEELRELIGAQPPVGSQEADDAINDVLSDTGDEDEDASSIDDLL